MIKTLLASMGAIIIASGINAQNYAIIPCAGETTSDIVKKCEQWGIETITESAETVPFVIVHTVQASTLDPFCYYAEIKQMDHHISFNSNKLLVRLKAQSNELASRFSMVPHRSVPNLYYYSPAVSNETELLAIKATLETNASVEYVSLNQVFTMDATVNDPLYGRQWAIENTGSAIQYSGTPGADMSVNDAWTITTGSSSIKIAVLDSGVDTLHEDLSNNLLPGFDGFATSGSGTSGYPTPNYQGDGHGTCCAGIIAAEGDNNVGIAGIAYTSKIIPVRIFYYVDYGGSIGIQATTTTDALLSGFAYAWRDANADVMSASAGLNDLFIAALGIDTVLVNTELGAAFWEARGWKGLPMFFSSGNDDISGVLWPAKLNTTIAVGASSMCDERKNPSDCSGEAWGGNYGPSLDVVAPGVKITTTDLTGPYGYMAGNYAYEFNGTSASCPNAAGVGALILSVNSGLHAADVRAILNITADRVAGYTYGTTTPHGTWNNEMGHGRVNANAAVLLAQTYQSTASLENSVQNDLITLFPNPSNGIVSVHVGDHKIISLNVMEINGKQVGHYDEIQNGSTIDLSHLSTGAYFIRATDGQQSSIHRFIKQ